MNKKHRLFINTVETHPMTAHRLKTICYFSEKMPIGFFVYIVNENNDLIFVNKKMQELFACSSKDELLEYVGYSQDNIMHPDDIGATNGAVDVQAVANPDGIIHTTFRILTKGGEIRWVDGYGTRTNIEEYGDVCFVFLIDVSKSKALEMDRETLSSYVGGDTLGYSFEAENSIAANEAGVLSGVNILLVDDNDLMRELSKDMLEEAGAIVTGVENGLEAVKLIKNDRQFDAILLDIVMPVMDGVEATKEINEQLKHKGIEMPIIVLTAEGTSEQLKQCIRNGAYAYMRKPFSILDLSRILLSYLRKHSDNMEKRLADTIAVSRRDALTGVKNASAYTAKVSQLVKELNHNQFMEIGVVLCDVNNLKEENDTYGHDSGDMYIKNCCKIMCETFKGSPVYRIGGDEFVVILEGNDYKNVETLMVQLENSMLAASALPDAKSGKAFFASGLAIYDRRIDKRFSDVVKRADIAMYENKKQLKGDSSLGYKG